MHTARLWCLAILIAINFIAGGRANEFAPELDGEVFTAVAQPDGRVVVAGSFATIGEHARKFIARLESNGAVDAGFNPSANASINALVVQPDGRIIVGGYFTELAGKSQSRLARLDADGELDASFKASADFQVVALALQPDGKILVAGRFSHMSGTPRAYLGRLNPDGTIDAEFAPRPNADVNALALQPDGKIVVGGNFTWIDGQSIRYLTRLLPNGRVDESFVGQVNGAVYCLSRDGRGGVLVGGLFSSLGDQPHEGLGRLLPDGRVDRDFEGGLSGDLRPIVFTILPSADNSIMLGGSFSTVQGMALTNFARLKPGGHLDPTSELGLMGPREFSLASLSVDAEGRVLVGGGFTNLAGIQQKYLGRLEAPGASRLGLLRHGTTWLWPATDDLPEFSWVAIESSKDGTNWRRLGLACRVEGGWELDGPEVVESDRVRARGLAPGGLNNGSMGMMEVGWGPPAVTRDPISTTRYLGAEAGFIARAIGNEPMAYQWKRNGVSLSDDERIEGATTARLNIKHLVKSDEATYSLEVANSAGSVTSTEVQLLVPDPAIVRAPTDTIVNAGEPAALRVEAAGSPPLDYQWFKDGIALQEQSGSILELTAAGSQDSGRYAVRVSNARGSQTSPAVSLTLNQATVDAFAPKVNGEVLAVAVQADGGIVVGGGFTKLEGQNRNYFGRFRADGSLEPSGGGPDNSVTAIAMQPDGQLLVGGNFESWDGHERKRIARLKQDGSLDLSFNPGASDAVVCFLVQPDERILVGGLFSTLAGQPRSRLGRLNPDGSLDASFDSGASFVVDSLALQADGKIVVGGRFKVLSGMPRDFIGRLNPDGSVDASFKAAANGWVTSVAIQSDGRILVAGEFSELCGQPRRFVGRLNGDGSLDETFNVDADGPVLKAKVQADGGILLAGEFQTLAGLPRKHLGRLEASGALDVTFATGASHPVFDLAIQADGKVVVGGRFRIIGGQLREFLSRLN